MEKIKLKIADRESKKPKRLRRDGAIPGTLYGPGQEALNVQVDAKEFSRLPSGAYSHMIELETSGKAPTNAVIRNVQRRSTNHQVLNIEFYRVALDRKLTMTVPLKFIGVSPAVAAGNQLIEAFQEVDIECLPADIPDSIEVDLGRLLEIEDALHFGDLAVADKVKILNPLDEVVAKVVAPRVVVEEETKEVAPVAGEAVAAPSETPAPND